MRIDANVLKLSASDLVRHLACPHLTELDREVARGCLETPPYFHDSALERLRELGFEHERAYVKSLMDQGLAVVDVRNGSGSALVRTLQAMRDGLDVIVQARLEGDRWAGHADILLRVEEPSDVGEWSYEVVDTKLAQETRAGTVLQLCVYTDLLGRLQGRTPEKMHVVKPGSDFGPETFRYADFHAYYRFVRDALEAAVASAPGITTYPHPVEYCDFCRWWQRCTRRRRDDDHLCLVAGIQRVQIVELHRQGRMTVEAFADRGAPLDGPPRKGSSETYQRLHAQARIQVRGRREDAPVHELIAPEPDRGLQRLPEPSPADIFFDIESARFVPDGGLEYLLGYVTVDGPQPVYERLWALSRDEEKRAVERFIDFVIDRWRRHAGMHVYHFAPYEPAALKRLVARHATRESDLDELLRGRRFADLHAVTRQGLRASVERYSLKDLEAFYRFRRDLDLRGAGAALERVQACLEAQAGGEVLPEDRDAVERYNRDDCLSALALRDWIEELRIEAARLGHELVRPVSESGEASAAVTDRERDVRAVFDGLVADLPSDRETWDAMHRARWLLAHQLEYFRREDRVTWWDYFRLHELDHEQALDERYALAGLNFAGEAEGGTAKCPVHRYHYPPQEVAIREGSTLHEVGGDEIGDIADMDQGARTIDIKKRQKAAGRHPTAVFSCEIIPAQPVDGSLLSLARSIVNDGVDGNGPFRAARDLLLRRRPRLCSDTGGALRRAGEPTLQAAIRLGASLDCGVLPIQGPPGTGKTYTGARMIVALSGAGRRIGVTAVSHKVIRNLLKEVLVAGAEARHPVAVLHKVTEETGAADGVEEVTDNGEALEALDDGTVVGGSAWLWARDDAVESLDYLFIDEAGQMALAQALATGRSARNIVLLGDPSQLEQPQQGAHPEGAEVSALEHLLADAETIPPDRGLFLDVTYRLHPDLCRFTSEMYYEDRLEPLLGLERQILAGNTPFAGSGLFYVPVEHEGNQNNAAEEVEAVIVIVEHLRGGVTWTNREGERRRLRLDDILIVAPYNAQVAAITTRLPGARVGTIDRFQGQEAPVVIYSMASSSSQDAPRGMSFLYDPNRLNVATSRARCACILVAAPAILEPECRTVDQMRRANGLCRFRELATIVQLETLAGAARMARGP